MKRGLILFLAACTLAAAMVPSDRRAVYTEKNKERNTPNKILVCTKQTPCGWAVHKPNEKTIQAEIMNTYCTCAVGMICEIDEDDKEIDVIIKRCQPPAESEDAEDISFQ